LSNYALLGKLSYIVEKLENVENNVKSLSCIEEGSVYFEREIAKLNRDRASESNLADQDQKIEERFKQFEAEIEDRFARFEKMHHALEDNHSRERKRRHY
jgi:hypothetical protein